MVHVYIADVRNLPDPKDHVWIMESLPDERKNKILGYVQVKDRKQSLGAGLLLKQIFETRGLNIANTVCAAHGKPEIQGMYFNLSHSYDYVVCAVSDQPIGCDIEKIGKNREKIAKHFFSVDERAYLESFGGDERLTEFYRLWTMKESYLKMTGEGLAHGLKQVECRVGNGVSVYRDGEKCHCFIKEYDLLGYKLSVCAKEDIFASDMEIVEL